MKDNRKTFVVRPDDRNFEVGDLLHLVEFDPTTERFTGREVVRRITFILRGENWGVRYGFAVLAITNVLE